SGSGSSAGSRAMPATAGKRRSSRSASKRCAFALYTNVPPFKRQGRYFRHSRQPQAPRPTANCDGGNMRKEETAPAVTRFSTGGADCAADVKTKRPVRVYNASVPLLARPDATVLPEALAGEQAVAQCELR